MYPTEKTTYEWYSALLKPEWAPPSWLFGPVWSVLYVLIAYSFCTVFYRAYRGMLPRYVALPFVVNLITNLVFTPLQFGLQSNILASVDILVVLVSLVWAMWVVRPYVPWVMYLQIPYLLWVCFATVLQLTITLLN